MQDGHVVTEAAAEAPHGLGRERDLRHEDDGAASALAHALDGIEVDLGLSRARDAVNEHDVPATRVRGPCDGVESGELAVREMVWSRRGGTRERGGLAGASDASAVLHLDEPALGERRDDRSRARHHGRELGHAHGPGDERLDDPALPAGVATWHEAPSRDRKLRPAVIDGLRAIHGQTPLARLVLVHAGRLSGSQHEPKAYRGGGGVLGRHPLSESCAHAVERGLGKHALDGQDAQRVHALRKLGDDVHDVAHRQAMGKAHEHRAANVARAGERVGDGVVKAPVDGAGGYVRNDLRVSHAIQFAT